MRVCIVDDEIENAKYVQRVLTGYQSYLFTSPEEAIEFVRINPVDIIVTDQKMPAVTGLELVRHVREHTEDFMALVISAYTETDDLIDAVNSNIIYKYIVKPFSPTVLLQHVHRAIEQLELRRSNATLRRQLESRTQALSLENRLLRGTVTPPMDFFVGDDPAMEQVKELFGRYAGSEEPVLITGETGTGKELLARALHEVSTRREQPFLPLNCSALPESTMESELFGYARGAFTGADRQKSGLLEAADGGVLFLDEIGDMSPALQAKLLRVIQFGTFIPVGTVKERSVNVRIISATNRDLWGDCERGRFRQDLYYRINPLHIHIPALRERRHDILPIARRIARNRGLELPPFSEEASNAVTAYAFPGNVRELASLVERLALLQRDRRMTVIDIRHLGEVLDIPIELNRPTDRTTAKYGHIAVHLPADNETCSIADMLASAEEKVILHVLSQEEHNISRTARRLGMSRQGLKNKLTRYGRGIS